MKAAIVHPAQAAELEAIVRALAESDPVGDAAVCVFCSQHVAADHRECCLWLRARKALGME